MKWFYLEPEMIPSPASYMELYIEPFFGKRFYWPSMEPQVSI